MCVCVLCLHVYMYVHACMYVCIHIYVCIYVCRILVLLGMNCCKRSPQIAFIYIIFSAVGQHSAAVAAGAAAGAAAADDATANSSDLVHLDII